MKKLETNYMFSASAKTITLLDYSMINQAGILLITNTTSNIIIYNFASPALGGTIVDNVLTLTYDTTAMSDGDAIQIYYDDGLAVSTSDDDYKLDFMLRLMLQKAVESPVWYDIVINALRITGAVTVTSGTITTVSTVTSVTGVTTVGSLTNQANMGGQPADQIAFNMADTDWALTTRNLLNTVIV